MVVHARAHKLSEGIVGPLPHPAVNDHAFCTEPDCLGLKLSILPSYRKALLGHSFVFIKHLLHQFLTCTAFSTSLKTDLCFLLSFLARCLLQSVARALSLLHSSSQSSQSKSWTVLRNRNSENPTPITQQVAF